MRVSPSSPSSPAISLEEVVGDEDRRDQREPLPLSDDRNDLPWKCVGHGASDLELAASGLSSRTPNLPPATSGAMKRVT